VVKSTNGAVRMVKLDIDKYPEIPNQMRVQSIPAVYAFKDGRPVDGFVGALPESQIKAFVQRLTGGKTGAPGSPLEEALEVAKQALAEGDYASAEQIFRQVVQRQPDNVPALIGLARCAVAAQDFDDAEAILAKLPADATGSAEVASIRTSIELARQAEKAAGGLGDLERRLAKNENDHEARLELANVQWGVGNREQAIDHLLLIFKRDREWQDQAARKQLLKLFEAMGPTDPLTVQGRKRLSSLLFS
jgi:putative thioredoxin